MATGQVARAECVKCHRRVPKTEAQQRTVEVKTGRSGSSLSFGIFTQSSRPRVNSGRNYYRKKTEWICHDCSGVTARLRREEQAQLARAEAKVQARLERQQAREAWLALTPRQRTKARIKSLIKWMVIISTVLIVMVECSKRIEPSPSSKRSTSQASPAPKTASATINAGQGYAAQVRAHVRPHITFTAPPRGRENPTVGYRADLSGTGHIHHVQIVTSSGDAQFDMAVQRGIKASSPLPKPPTRAYPAYIEGQYRMYD